MSAFRFAWTTLPAGFGNMTVRKDPHVPLAGHDADGREFPALCWIVVGYVLVHPDRWDAFQAALRATSYTDEAIGPRAAK